MAIPQKQEGDKLLATEVNEIVDRLSYVHIFNNVADMQSFTDFSDGDFVKWRGYYNPGDGGDNTGQFKTTWSKPHNGGTVFGIGILGKVVADIHNREVNFLQFGAIDNGTNTIFSNDSSAAIQAAISSDFHVRASAGYFYIADTIHLDTEKHIEFLGSGKNESGLSPYPGQEPPYATQIYTDQDIDIFRVEAGGITFTGGVVDCSKIPIHTKSAFNIDVGKGQLRNHISTTVYGNGNTLTQKGNGTTAVLYDLVDTGWIHAASWLDRFDLFVGGCKHVFKMTEKFTNQWCPWIELKATAIYCKQPLYMASGHNFKAQMYIQAGPVLHEDEKDWSQVYFSKAVGDVALEVQLADMGKGFDPIVNGWFPEQKNGIENHSKSISLIGKSWNQYGPNNIIRDGDFPYYNNSGFFNDIANLTIPSTLKRGPDSTWISDLSNSLTGVHKRVAGYALKAYDGSSFDFDANLSPAATYSTPETTKITFTYPNGIFDKSTRYQSSFVYGTSTSSDITDFVEIVIPEFKRYGAICIKGNTVRMHVDRLQIIREFSNGNKESYYIENRNTIWRASGSEETYDFTFPNNTSSKLIIRFIGANNKSGTSSGFIIQDIVALAPDADFPVISTAGDQRIYGDLKLGAVGEPIISIRDLYNMVIALQNP